MHYLLKVVGVNDKKKAVTGRWSWDFNVIVVWFLVDYDGFVFCVCLGNKETDGLHPQYIFYFSIFLKYWKLVMSLAGYLFEEFF